MGLWVSLATMVPRESGNQDWFSSPITSPLLGPPLWRVFQRMKKKENQLQYVIRPLRSSLK